MQRIPAVGTQAFIQGGASAKQKKALVRSLAGSWGALAAQFGGSHLVDKCFDFAVRVGA